MRNLFFLLFLLSLNSVSIAQLDVLDEFRFGAGVKLQAEYQYPGGIKFRLSATAGVAQYVPLSNNNFGLLPSAHIGVLFYNKGILGSNLNSDYYRTTFFDFFANATLTAGGENITNKNALRKRWVPLYHFSDFSANPLQNTFDYSASLGSNWLMNPDINRASQTIGFFNLNIARYAQISYYNDGGPLLKYFGDKEDRYYTGGLTLSAHLDSDYYFNMIELSFHKFTGWQPFAVDAADKLQLDHVPYENKEAFGFNQQQWTLRSTSFRQGYSTYFTLYDVNAFDLQDFLHFNSHFPYHPDYYYQIRIGIGGSSEFNTTQND